MEKRYEQRKEEEYLHSYAQYNEHCEKIWGLTESTFERGEFQRDRERIVNSKAFRRMVDKAQIFTSSKGDHYRTRMTHTMEVAQIARSISNSLRLNIDLTEAIALGHDLGHTPFGHQGERTLYDILAGNIDVGLPHMVGKNVYGGFKHNVQSVRTINCLEEKYADHEGLDVSYQVLEGVLKHTKFQQRHCDGCTAEKCSMACCDLRVFLGKGDVDRLYIQYPFSTTLEGQVVAVADEIAQRSHDVDDAMSAGLLDFDELQVFLINHQMMPLWNIMEKSFQKLQSSGRTYVSERYILCARVISDIINYLVNDVLKEARSRIEKFEENELYKTRHRFSEQLIGFSEEGDVICGLLERMVSAKVIGSSEVSRFDYTASQTIETLFKIYYAHPKLLNENTLKKAYIDMQEKTGCAIHFAEDDPQRVNAELNAITQSIVSSDYSCGSKNQQMLWTKHVILVRAITDYIAGMTDSYALNEYKALKR